ncbi:MAG TPA: hypothetical protein VFB67_08490 [Candidatus Polarisedimenticolaceae bacterium]|nr:hypothetical protein [Candidatus Polarisedimenticolaceae bacterium]
MIAALLIVALALAVAAFVLGPLFRPDAREAERVAGKISAEQDLTAQHAMALSALRDLEEDRATGKIGDSDYAEMKERLASQAVALMKRLDALAAERR